MPYRRNIQHAQFSKEAANSWLQLPDGVKQACSEAAKAVFFAVIEADDPDNLDGATFFGGTLRRLGRYFGDDYYCGFKWEHPAASFICYVTRSPQYFVVPRFFDESHDTTGGIRRAAP